MSIISAGTNAGNSFIVTSETSGNLVIQTGSSSVNSATFVGSNQAVVIHSGMVIGNLSTRTISANTSTLTVGNSVTNVVSSNGTTTYSSIYSNVTIDASNGIDVGANIAITANSTTGDAIQIGNSTVNLYMTILGALNGYFAIQNSTVTISANNTGFYAGANSFANLTTHFVGNATVNSYLTQTAHVIANSTATTTANTLGVYVGANSYINAIAHVVSNATVTTTANTLGVYVGANSYINATTHFVGNSTVNSYMTQTSRVVSNSTVTVTANTTGFFAGANVYANLTSIYIGGNTINSTTYSGLALTSNNASYLGGVSSGNYQLITNLSTDVLTLTANNTSFVGSVSAANVVSNAQLSANLANYQTTAGLSANVATLSANNASYLGGVAAASYVNTTGNYTISGVHTHTANLSVNGAILAAGSPGTAGQVLMSNGTSNVYWSSPAASVTGSNTQIQFNNSGALGSSADLTFDGTYLASPYLKATNSSGDEGGEILLVKPQTNSSISGTGVTIDVFQNKIRFFEQGGSARGAYIDITAASAGAGSNLLTGGGGGGSGTVTQVNSANGITGGPITGSGTLYVNANTGIIANSSGIFLDTTGAYSFSGIHTYTANVVVNSAIIAAGSPGSAGQVLTSNGTSNVYWSTPSSSPGTSVDFHPFMLAGM